MNFSERLDQLCAESDHAQKDLAHGIGISEGALINYRRNRVPKATELLRIAEYVGVSTDWLLTGRENAGMKSGTAAGTGRARTARENQYLWIR